MLQCWAPQAIAAASLAGLRGHPLKTKLYNVWTGSARVLCGLLHLLLKWLGSDSSVLAHAEAFTQQLQQSEQPAQLYAAALEICRALAAAAPLPVVCNNIGCKNLAGVSEAAAASKACTGCMCRFCSAATGSCTRIACRCMAAAGGVVFEIVTCGDFVQPL
ncbi:hypothetical protein COO60DRAFT_1656493 [Scenedesmus sp. NREL 46B-D3]|nr:hypothetical protein COO60DRAFT_1656493 [Scenedesmus sp. NREL 46B-D3]